MIRNFKKEAKQILAASLYEPYLHGDKFRQETANNIIDRHISKISITTSSEEIIIEANVSGDVRITNNRCMDFYSSEIVNSDDVFNHTGDTINFNVIQKYNNNGDEIKTKYYYKILYI